jgi:hypothetical protein
MPMKKWSFGLGAACWLPYFGCRIVAQRRSSGGQSSWLARADVGKVEEG